MQRHVWPEHGDAIVVGEGEELVVVHDGVHVFNPDGVHGTIEDEPREMLLVLVGLAPEGSKDALGPFVGDDVQKACGRARRTTAGIMASETGEQRAAEGSSG